MVKTMQNLQQPPPPIPHPNPSINHRVIAFTTPQNYAGRLSNLLHLKGWTPLWCPTVIIEPTPHTIHQFLSPQSTPKTPLEDFAAIAFTSRTGISAFSQALTETEFPPLSPVGPTFTISALGNDSELLNDSFIKNLCKNPERIRVLIPPVAIPSRMVESLGFGKGRGVLCPVPLVIGLEEPPVVPEFLRDLALKGWAAVRVNAYETRWAGAECVEELVVRSEKEGCGLDAIVFTSTGEVEGLLKGLGEWGLDWTTMRKRCPKLVVAAHGPVTAAGAERLGVGVDVAWSNGRLRNLKHRVQCNDDTAVVNCILSLGTKGSSGTSTRTSRLCTSLFAWSNGRLRNVKHRVQCNEATILRLSTAPFLLGTKGTSTGTSRLCTSLFVCTFHL